MAASDPPSPGVSPVPLAAAARELLRFVLSSHLASSEADLTGLGLSAAYCSRLLRSPDDSSSPSSPGGADIARGGVPTCALYEKLAAELVRYAEGGEFPRLPEAVGVPAEERSEAKEREWEALLVEKGAELTRMYDAVEFELHVQEPFFTQLKAGSKKVEGRLAAGNYNRVAQGSLLLFNKCLLLNVERVTKYSSFSEMLQAEKIANVLPGIASIEEGVKIYRNFYMAEKEKSFGVLAISVSKPQAQPYIIMKELLAGLGYNGLGRLLGMASTVGTVPDGLPPPLSALTASSMKPHLPNVKGCSLTDAARALAKHVNRSSDGWWDDFHGSDSNKNQLASKIIGRLLLECCWMNVHLIQPYGSVFEIRVHEGYGARWSQDGSKFIGFLEPYTPEGFSKGWKH